MFKTFSSTINSEVNASKSSMVDSQVVIGIFKKCYFFCWKKHSLFPPEASFHGVIQRMPAGKK